MSTLKRFSLKSEKSDFQKVKITEPVDAYKLIREFYFDDIDIFESAFILLVNNANTTIGYAKISQGGVAGTVLDTRIIAKFAVDSLASGVILAHNHPSGNIQASQQDILATKKIAEGLKTLDVVLIDHLIITSDNFLSMKKNNLIQ